MQTRTLESHSPDNSNATDSPKRQVSSVDITALENDDLSADTKKPVHGEDGACCGGCGG